MGQGNFSHTSFDSKGSLVPYRTSADRPLLPWEKQIIDILGCSVEEYKWFVNESVKQSRIRPAAYANIPDVQAGDFGLSILISIIVGAVFTGASYLLTPKPRMPSAERQRGGGQVNLPSRAGVDRYAQTSGFDSLADLAVYGEAIPIVWTKWTGTTGGVLFSPKLVWSRVVSQGNQQAGKMLYVVAEGGVQPPDLAGIYVGNNGLDTLRNKDFAFWWNSSGKVTRSNFYYGSQGQNIDGDPETSTDIFVNPVGTNAFCHAYTPTSGTRFGVASPIPNGTQYRVNWRVVSIPEATEEKSQLRRERAKVCGFGAEKHPIYDYRQVGVGVNYPRRQGLAGNSKQVITVTEGQTIQFVISGVEIVKYLWGGDPTKTGADSSGGAEMTDVNNSLNSECAAADDILQLGETVMIGGSIWRVSNRSLTTWNVGQTQTITLKCIEILESNTIGIPGSGNFISAGYITRNNEDEAKVVNILHWPLLRVATASIKNTRPCNATEIGIRSNVWGRFNGLCNFNTLPRSKQIENWDNNNVTVTTGTMTEYFQRTAVFTVHWREIGGTSWVKSNRYFAVTGSSPTDQFNALTVLHKGKVALEFRLIPVPASVVAKLSDDYVLYLLTGSGTFSVEANGVTITGKGSPIKAGSVSKNPQMVSEGKTTYTPPSTSTAVTGVNYYGKFFGKQGEFKVWSRVRTGIFNVNALPVGSVHIAEYTNIKDSGTGDPSLDGRTVTLQLYLVVEVGPGGSKRFNEMPQKIVVKKSTSGPVQWAVGQKCNDIVTTTVGYTIDGQYFPPGEYGVSLDVAAVKTTTTPGSTVTDEGRTFENNTQLAEVSYYGSLITRSCDSDFEHSITHVNEYVGITDSANTPTFQNLTTAAVAFRANRNIGSMDQLRCWISSGINNSNSFPDLIKYLLQNVNELDPALLDLESFTAASTYCASRKLFFDGVIGDRVNLRSYITELAPFFLLNFVIANGKFALQPAVPETADVPISQIFTADNIIEDSLKFEYLAADQRRDFQAVMTYRTQNKNELPVLRTLRTRFTSTSASAPIEAFDMSAYCTSRDHAKLAARYFLSIRKRVTHSIQFKTVPEGAGIAPGAFIKVALQQTAVSSYSNGVISASGVVTSPQPLADGRYLITYYRLGTEDLIREEMVLVDGRTRQPQLFNSLYTLADESISTAIYQVEQIELDKDGLVNVTATEFPAADIVSDMAGVGITEYDE